MNRQKIVSSMFYKFIERFAVKGVGLIIGIILARLLSPENFGQVALLSVFTALASTVIQSGMSSALIQKNEVDEGDYSTAFYLCLAISLVMVAILWLCAPLIASFYELPMLILPIRVCSLSLIIGVFNSIQVAKIQREMRFKSMMWTTLISAVASGVLGVTLAYFGFGIWALIAYEFSSTVLSCVTMSFVAKWFPKPIFSIERAKSLYSYGWKMLVSAILCSVYGDIRSLVVGKKYSTESLGYYNKGQQYPGVISGTIESAIQAVMFPAMSREQSDPSHICSMLKKTISFGAFIIVPTMLGLAAVSETFTLVLLTEKWLPSVIFMQIMCIGDIAYSFTSTSLVAIKSLGRSDVYMKLEFVRRIIMLAILLVTIFAFDSVIAIAVGGMVSMWVDVIVISVPVKKLFGCGPLQMLRDNWKPFVAGGIMALVVMLVGLIPVNRIVLLGLQIVVGACVYVALSWFMKNESLEYLINILKKKTNQ